MATDCKHYEDMLVQEALGENTEKDRAALRAHLDSCSGCRGELARLADTIGAFKRERSVVAPAGLAERTLRRVERTGARFVAASSPYRETRLLKPGSWQVRRSLVGWMVAASILVMAVASLVPGMISAEGSHGIVACQEHMKTVAVALRQYAADHDGFYPHGTNWYKALDYKYLQQTGSLLCPGRLAIGSASKTEVDFVYNPARTSLNDSPDYPLMWDRKAAHDRLGRNVLQAGGNVVWMSEEKFEMLMARYKIDEGAIFANPVQAEASQPAHDSAPAVRDSRP